MATEPTRRALRQTGMPPYEMPLAAALVRRAATDGARGSPGEPIGVLPIAPPPPPPPGLADIIGAATREMFPTINQARVNTGRISDNVAAGNYGEALGNTISSAAAYPVAAANDFVGRPLAAIARGGMGVLRGALGLGAGSEAVVQTQKASMQPTKAVEQALAQGRAADVSAVTPQDALGTYITNMLTQGTTNANAARLGALVPAVTKGGPKLKEVLLDKVAAGAERDAAQSVAAIDADVQAGRLTPEEGIANRAKATDIYFQKMALLLGGDPTKLALAERMSEEVE